MTHMILKMMLEVNFYNHVNMAYSKLLLSVVLLKVRLFIAVLIALFGLLKWPKTSTFIMIVASFNVQEMN